MPKKPKPPKPPKPKKKDPMPFPTKPAAPSLQADHAFAADLQAAWLFVESTGVTIGDFSNNSRHLVATNVSDLSWGNDGGLARFLKLSSGAESTQLSPLSSIAALNFLAADDWSLTMLVRRQGAGGAGKPRLHSRVGNKIDVGLSVPGEDHAFQFFSGAAWVTIVDSNASGAYEHIVLTSNSGGKFYKNGVPNATNPQPWEAIDNTGQIYFGTAPSVLTEQWVGDIAAIFYHSRELSAAEVLSNFNSPFAAWEPIPPVTLSTPPYIGMIDRDYYKHEDSYQGGSDHLLDWLSGK